MKTGKTAVALALILVVTTAQAFSQVKPVRIELAAIRTELKQHAVSAGITYLKSLDSLFTIQDILLAGDNTLFQLTPEFNLLTGTGDAFSSMNVKISGIFMRFGDTLIDGIITPNTARGFHTFPLSAGLETNNGFTVLNGIAEAGWVPWYQTAGNRNTPAWLKRTRLGLFVQAGYKFDADTTGIRAIGGEADQSGEKPGHAILRAKGSLNIDTQSLFEMSGTGAGLAGSADAWYDLLNGKVYYSVEAKIRFFLAGGRFFDFTYRKGSGAPNFNKGEQFGMGLTLMF